MAQHIVKINSINHVTHYVLRIVSEKPQKHTFSPGQATEVSINKSGWKDEKRPFTFTCIQDSDYLEFTIKTYPSRKGVTNELLHLKKNETGNNKLIFANKTKADIILANEFKKLLGKNFINILSDEKADGYVHGQIKEGFLKAHIIDLTKNVYICGPPPMMDSIEKQFANLKIDEKLIIKEVF